MTLALQEFQRNTAFVLFVVIVVSAAFLFLIERLRPVLIPLIWAFFFALPILAFADHMEALTIILMSRLAALLCGGHYANRLSLPFQHNTGQNCIHLENTEATAALVKHVESRCSRRCVSSLRCSWLVWLFNRLDKSFLSRMWGQRVRITRLESGCSGSGRPHVGALVEGRSYYAFPNSSGELLADDAERTSVELHLYLDRQQTYPAVVWSHGSEVVVDRLHGELEVDRRSTLSWAVSMVAAFCVVASVAWVFMIMIGKSIAGLQNNLEHYKQGIEEFIDDVKKTATHILPAKFLDKVKDQLVSEISTFGKQLAQESLSYVEDVIGSFFLFILYLMFWIAEPLPINAPTAKVFKDYMTLKTVVCLMFAAIMAGLLWWLACPIWPLYFFLTFLLNYIPEVGPILAGLLMLPAVLLDAEFKKADRYAKVMVLVVVGTLAKILTGNIIEVKLYSRFGGEFMKIHPVVLFVFFTFCGYQLGLTGMFISVPILAAVKYTLVSRALPERYLHAVLTIIEGDMWAGHKNLVSRQIHTEASQAPATNSVELGGSVDHEMRPVA